VATWDDVRGLALALPETAEVVSRGLAQWKVKAKPFVWDRPLRKADLKALGGSAPDGEILGAYVEHEVAKQALLEDPSGVFFTTPHFDGYPVILARLAELDDEALEEVVAEAWLAQAPKKLARAYLDDLPPR